MSGSLFLTHRAGTRPNDPGQTPGTMQSFDGSDWDSLPTPRPNVALAYATNRGAIAYGVAYFLAADKTLRRARNTRWGEGGDDALWATEPVMNGREFVQTAGAFGQLTHHDLDTNGCEVILAHSSFGHRVVTVYDPANDSVIESAAPWPPPNDPGFTDATSRAAVTIDHSGRVYVEFGNDSASETAFFRFDIYSGVWKQLATPTMSGGIGNPTSLHWAAGRVWRADSFGRLHEYDPVTDAWTAPVGVSLTTELNTHVVSDKKIWQCYGAWNGFVREFDTDTGVYTAIGGPPPIQDSSVFYEFHTWLLPRLSTEPIDLDQDQLSLCFCIRLTRVDGQVFGFTTHDRALWIEGLDYHSIDSVKATAMRQELGVGVDNMDVMGLLSSDLITETDLRAGLFDNARVRVFIADWSAPWRPVIELMQGFTGEVQIAQGSYVAEVRSLSQRHGQQIGELTSPICRVRVLGDERCKVDLTSYTYDRSVTAVGSERSFSVVDPHAYGYYNYGLATFLTGANAGLSREVKQNNYSIGANEIVLQEAFPFDVQVGDQVRLVAGCDRLIESCYDKFNNVVNFRGEPHMPGNDQLLKRGDK